MGLRISIKGRVCPSVRLLVGLSNLWSHGSAFFFWMKNMTHCKKVWNLLFINFKRFCHTISVSVYPISIPLYVLTSHLARASICVSVGPYTIYQAKNGRFWRTLCTYSGGVTNYRKMSFPEFQPSTGRKAFVRIALKLQKGYFCHFWPRFTIYLLNRSTHNQSTW